MIGEPVHGASWKIVGYLSDDKGPIIDDSPKSILHL